MLKILSSGLGIWIALSGSLDWKSCFSLRNESEYSKKTSSHKFLIISKQGPSKGSKLTVQKILSFVNSPERKIGISMSFWTKCQNWQYNLHHCTALDRPLLNDAYNDRVMKWIYSKNCCSLFHVLCKCPFSFQLQMLIRIGSLLPYPSVILPIFT